MAGNRTIIESPVFLFSNKPKGYFTGGEIKFTNTVPTSNNIGVSRSIISHEDGFVQVRIAFPEDIQTGDSFNAWAGCNKTGDVCQNKFIGGGGNIELIDDIEITSKDYWTVIGDSGWWNYSGWQILNGKSALYQILVDEYGTLIEYKGTDTLTPIPQLTTVVGKTYAVQLSISGLTNYGFDFSIGGTSGTTIVADGNYLQNLVAVSTAGFIVTPLTKVLPCSFKLNSVAITGPDMTSGNYANFFGFEYVPRPEVML